MWPEIDSGMSFDVNVSNKGILELYEFIETLEYPDTPIVVTFHISAHAELENDEEHKEFTAPSTSYLKSPTPQVVSYIAFQLGKHLSQRQAGFRVQDFSVDNSGERYTVKLVLRPIGLPDLVNLRR